MVEALTINPQGIYTDSTLVLGLGLTHAALAKARRSGELRFARKGRRALYRGTWILNWLDGEKHDETMETP